ncbi:MAG: DUF488 family protein [Nitrospira sp.]
MARPRIAIKRIYEPVDEGDGYRILVDRLWPRGISKAAAHIDLWLRDLGPSTELRRWFDHDPARWTEFSVRYRTELQEQEALIEIIRQRAQAGPVMLLYAARDEERNQAVVLQNVLKQLLKRKRVAT